MNGAVLVLSVPAAWLMGLSASVHCALMCMGPNSLPAASQAHNGHRAALWLHAGRITGYLLLGALAGWMGTLLLRALPSAEQAQGLRAVAGFVLVAAGLWLLRKPMQSVHGCPMQARRGAHAHWYVQGLAWSVTPCPTLYAMLLVAAISGGPWQGATLMLAFALGTAPLLLGQHLVFMQWRPRGDIRRWRAVGLCLAGGVLILSGMTAEFAPGLFCLPTL